MLSMYPNLYFNPILCLRIEVGQLKILFQFLERCLNRPPTFVKYFMCHIIDAKESNQSDKL